eukprot:comp24292_c0_seq1/m.45501 comp24292_c0_seq1/g.45501  ORF comp24292_c0_seq1/g.45501 comp24292_c0_seq1/m.45501 type:complete len:994 (+) comp24292_c0_seq1:364-3345(+)
MEILALPCRLDDSGADHKVAELPPLEPLLCIAENHRSELVQNLLLVHRLPVNLVQPLTCVACAEVQVVHTGGTTDHCNLGDVRAGATVRATRHTDCNGVIAKAGLFKGSLNLGDEGRKVALGFGKGKTARGEGDARHRVQAHAGKPIVSEIVLAEEILNHGLLLGGDVSNNHVLVGGKAEITRVNLCNLAEARLELKVGCVENAPVRDVEAIVPVSTLALSPPVPVAVVGELVLAGSLELITAPRLHLVAIPLDTAVVDGVLQTGVLAVRAVAVIALNEHHLLANVNRLFGRAEAQHLRQARVRLLVVVRHPHAAAHRDIVTDKLSVLHDGDVPKAVRKHVDVVVWRDANGNLELAGKVGGPVKGLDVLRGTHRLLVEPDLVVGRRAGGEVRREVASELVHLGVNLRLERVGVAHDVAVHIAARRERVHQSGVDRLDGGLQVALNHTVQLVRLAGSELNRAVGVAVAQSVHGEPLSRRRDAAGDAHADHEGEGLLETLLAAFLTKIAVVLLIDTVELGELGVRLAQGARGRVCETLKDGPAEEVGAALHVVVRLFGRAFAHLDLVYTKCLPDLRLPLLVGRPVPILVLVVTQTQGHHPLATHHLQPLIKVPARLGKVDLLLGAGPVVAVTEGKHGEARVVERRGGRLEALPELLAVCRELSLPSRRHHKDHIGLEGQIIHSKLLRGHAPHRQTAKRCARRQMPSNTLTVSSVGTEENQEGLRVESSREGGESGGGLVVSRHVLRFQNSLCGFCEGGCVGGGLLSKLREVVVALEEVRKGLLDRHAVKAEALLALLLELGVPAVEGPQTSVDGLLRLLEHLEGHTLRRGLHLRQVGEHDGWAHKGIGFLEGLDRLSVRRIHSNRRHVAPAIVHGVEPNVPLELLKVVPLAQRVRLRVNHKHVHILAGRNHVMNTAVADITRPIIGANQPPRRLVEKLCTGRKIGQGIRLAPLDFENLLGLSGGGADLSRVIAHREPIRESGAELLRRRCILVSQ